MSASRGGNWNRHVPPAREVLIKLARQMIDEQNARQDYGLTWAHIRNLVEKLKLDRAALVDVFLAGLGSSTVDAEISRKIAEIFADDVLREVAQ